MFMTRSSVAVLAGLAMAAATLMAPGAVASPVEGRAVTWGTNSGGALGNNSLEPSRVPVAVDTSGALAGKTVTAITAGGEHRTCAVAEDRAYCWGRNDLWELGDGSFTGSPIPVAVDTSVVLAGKTVTTITAGGNHTCAVADGRAYCWGFNNHGQLGNASLMGARVPVAVDASGVLAGRTVTAIAAGEAHSCAVADGQVYCWGSNYYGQLGDNSTTDSAVPVAVDASGVLAGKTVTALSAGPLYSCAVADGRAFCWGLGGAGQLGDGKTTDSPVPVAVDDTGPLSGKAVTAISAGTVHTCAIADSKAFCWGDNGSGRLGNNTTKGSPVPIAVASGVLARKRVTAITAGGTYSCAVADGQAYCWGRNSYGQLGNDSTRGSRIPVAVTTSGVLKRTSISAIAASARHTAAIAEPMTSVPEPPTAPRRVKVVVKKRKAKITWKPLTAATSYRVRISKPGGKRYKKWKTTSTRVFKAKVRRGKKYRFQVAAVGVGGRGPTTTKRFKAR